MRDDVVDGMIVRSSDGRQLGRIVGRTDDSFFIDKGLFFRREYLVRADQISEVRGGEVWLTATSLQLIDSSERREGRAREEEEAHDESGRPGRSEPAVEVSRWRHALAASEKILSDPGRDPDKY